MHKIIFYLSFLLIAKAYSQDYAAIKYKTDSIWKHKIKTRHRTFKSEFDSVSNRVSYDKKTKEVIEIDESHYPDPTSLTNRWVYKYHFRKGHIILISRWNNTSQKDPKRQNAFYYFENGQLLYADEMKTSISDIGKEVIKAMELLARFSQL